MKTDVQLCSYLAQFILEGYFRERLYRKSKHTF